MTSKERARPTKNPYPMSDLEIFDIPNLDAMDDDDDIDAVDDSDLESELEAILSGKTDNKPVRPKNKIVAPLDIEKMAAECIKDISDEENDDDESFLNDPDLLQELRDLSCESPIVEDIPDIDSISEKTIHVKSTPIVAQKTSENIITVLDERLQLYTSALAATKAMNDSSKVRRYSRAVKTLEQLLKSAKFGRNVNEEDIPPIVSIPKQHAQPASNVQPDDSELAAKSVPIDNLINSSSETKKQTEEVITEQNNSMVSLSKRRDEYKIATLETKGEGDRVTALSDMNISKGFDEVIEAMKNGESVDLLNKIPRPPSPYKSVIVSPVSEPSEKDEKQISSDMEVASVSAATEPEYPVLFSAPPAPTTVLEALEQPSEPSKKENDEIQTSSAIEATALSAATEPEHPELFADPPAPTTVLEALEQQSKPSKKEHDEVQTSSAIEGAALSAATKSEDPVLFSVPPAYSTVFKALKKRSETSNKELVDVQISSAIEGAAFSTATKPEDPVSFSVPTSSTVLKALGRSETSKKEHGETQTSPEMEAAALSVVPEPDLVLFAVPPAPTTVLEALQQQLQKFKATKTSAEAEENTLKVRRLQRIIKSYEKAIKDTKAGRLVDFDELPVPPGFATIPLNRGNKLNASAVSTPQNKSLSENSEDRPDPVPSKRIVPEVLSKTVLAWILKK